MTRQTSLQSPPSSDHYEVTPAASKNGSKLKDRLLVPFAVAATVFLLDQATKWIVRDQLSFGEVSESLGIYLRIVHWGNKGAAFGVNFGGPVVHALLSVAALGALSYVAWHSPSRHRLSKWGFGLIAGGAVGNLMDRLMLGHVTDFLDVGFSQTLRWPAFNLADAGVVVGVVLLLLGQRNSGEKSKVGSDVQSEPVTVNDK